MTTEMERLPTPVVGSPLVFSMPTTIWYSRKGNANLLRVRHVEEVVEEGELLLFKGDNGAAKGITFEAVLKENVARLSRMTDA